MGGGGEARAGIQALFPVCVHMQGSLYITDAE